MEQDDTIINQGVKLLHVLLQILAKTFTKYIVECTVQLSYLLWHAKEMNITHSREWFRSTDLWVMGPARHSA